MAYTVRKSNDRKKRQDTIDQIDESSDANSSTQLSVSTAYEKKRKPIQDSDSEEVIDEVDDDDDGKMRKKNKKQKNLFQSD